jgi:hypothetical protein
MRRRPNYHVGTTTVAMVPLTLHVLPGPAPRAASCTMLWLGTTPLIFERLKDVPDEN